MIQPRRQRREYYESLGMWQMDIWEPHNVVVGIEIEITSGFVGCYVLNSTFEVV